MTHAERMKLERYKAELAARFRARRCTCGAPAMSVRPGSLELREAGILLKPAVPDRNTCLACLLAISARETAAHEQ